MSKKNLASQPEEVTPVDESKQNTNEASQPEEVTPVDEKASELVLRHNEEKYVLPAGEKKNFIVRHSRTFTSPGGALMEDPASVRIQIYRPEVYADLVYEDEKTGKLNAFNQSGEKSIVLNDPTK